MNISCCDNYQMVKIFLHQVLLSIQSLILVPDPYFNEPGYESSMGTAQGNLQSRDYNNVIEIEAIRWAMIDHLENPKSGFEDVKLPTSVFFFKN